MKWGQASRPARMSQPGGMDGVGPAAMDGVPDALCVHLDVREDIARGREPFARIMAAAEALGAGQVLMLRAPFEPLPLYRVLGARGFSHRTARVASDDWTVAFYRDGVARPDEPPAPAVSAGVRRVLDVRGLEPPEPMVRVLEAIEALGPDAELEVHHERRPLFLYPQLDERGFAHVTDEPEPGLVRIVIHRRMA